jgi:hypothetical protein
MAITLTDSTGRQYRFTGTEEHLLHAILIRNIESRRELIAAIIDFDTKRMKLMADVLAGKQVGEYGYPREPADPEYKARALGWILDEYNQSMKYLRAALGDCIDAEITAYRAAAPTHSQTGRPATRLSVAR